MGDVGPSAAYGRAAKAAGLVALGCLQVALWRKRNKERPVIYFRVYVRAHARDHFLPELLEIT